MINAKKMSVVSPFGKSQERDSSRMIDEIQEEIIRNVKPDIHTVGVILDPNNDVNKKELENLEEESFRRNRNRGENNRNNRTVDIYYNDNNQNLFGIAQWVPTQLVPVTASKTVVPDFSQRQIGDTTLQLVRIPKFWKSNTTPFNCLLTYYGMKM
ncbi:MAG: hypothetical protein EZS28_006663 [Streblomastix strix]|uniref:Uncharacterized protein n=1 Tax=Streblomastix strix TaxID=222440 RepID=A0A5J4WTD7_9EUKA|nr:MAG: hypothetical protein EZS28_006663 [Streblomastix strix]